MHARVVVVKRLAVLFKSLSIPKLATIHGLDANTHIGVIFHTQLLDPRLDRLSYRLFHDLVLRRIIQLV